MKLIFITVCGVCGVLLLAYAGQAAFTLLNGRPISHAQRYVLDCIVVIVPIVAWIVYQAYGSYNTWPGAGPGVGGGGDDDD